MQIGGVLHNVLYVATSNATLYAYDADTTVQNPVPLWTRSLGTPFRPGHPDIWNCSNGTTVNGPAGIIGTPVIDLSTNTMYVVGNLSASGNQHKLFAIEITSGNDKLPPVVIASSSGVSPAFLASTHNQRPGLLLADYRVLFGYASFGDGPPYQGWMFNFNRGSLGLLDNWNYVNATSPGGAGIWMSGGGPAFDGRSVYFSTGNPKPDSFVATQYGNSLLRVDPQEGTSPGNNGIGLAKINQYLPPQAANWGNDADKDLGSSRVIVVPGTNYALVGGKAGNIYVVDRSTNQQSTLYSPFNIAPGGNLNTGGPEISGGLAYWNGTIYTWAQADKLSSFSLNGTSANTPNSLYTPRGEQGSALSISSNFDTNGLLWAVYPDGDDASHNNNSTGQMLVYRASDLSFLATYDLTGDHFIKFTPPVVANGKVFVVTQGKWASSPAIPPRVLVYGQ